jgi:NAD+ synthase (glutamine-hydrolysing)
MVVNADGEIVHRAKRFKEDHFIVDLKDLKPVKGGRKGNDVGEVREALVLGIRDYMRKCGFEKAVIGVSGGIDSAVVAALACEAIGANNVIGVLMPSPYTAEESIKDAKQLARNLKFETRMIPIDGIYESYRKTLKLKGKKSDISVAEENLQARARGNILMAISNREGAIVLSTGNKSELAVGYCTLYGDMAGGLAVISDVPKTMVYALAKLLNEGAERVPPSIIQKPPSAELKPDQTDQDNLPDYEVLDQILKLYVEDHMSSHSIVEMGFNENTVKRVVRMVDGNEYKRRQAPPGFKVTSKAFGSGRRFPIARKMFW